MAQLHKDGSLTDDEFAEAKHIALYVVLSDDSPKKMPQATCTSTLRECLTDCLNTRALPLVQLEEASPGLTADVYNVAVLVEARLQRADDDVYNASATAAVADQMVRMTEQMAVLQRNLADVEVELHQSRQKCLDDPHPPASAARPIAPKASPAVLTENAATAKPVLKIDDDMKMNIQLKEMDNAMAAPMVSPDIQQKLLDLEENVAKIHGPDEELLPGVTWFRKLLSIRRSPPIDKVVQCRPPARGAPFCARPATATRGRLVFDQHRIWHGQAHRGGHRKRRCPDLRRASAVALRGCPS